MLPAAYQQMYEDLRQQIQGLSAAIAVNQPDPQRLQQQFLQCQQLFQQCMVRAGDELAQEVLPQVQAYEVELNKQFRLMGVDIMFLQSARQSATRTQRQAQLRDRLQLLLTYCDRVLEL